MRPLGAIALAACGCVATGADGWSHYGGSLADNRYVVRSAITPASVDGLALAWMYSTGDSADGRETRLRATPIIVEGKLVVSTRFNRVIAREGRMRETSVRRALRRHVYAAGSLLHAGNVGGTSWGSMAYDRWRAWTTSS